MLKKKKKKKFPSRFVLLRLLALAYNLKIKGNNEFWFTFKTGIPRKKNDRLLEYS